MNFIVLVAPASRDDELTADHIMIDAYSCYGTHLYLLAVREKLFNAVKCSNCRKQQ